MFRLFILVTILFSFIHKSHATHIVGGEMSYKCLGNNKYQIFLTVYRDCKNGQPPFDDPAIFIAFDANNNGVDTFYANPMGNDTIPVVFPDTCLVSTDTVCVHRTSYIATITLAPRVGGYQIVYQRCCRNKIIDNIINPEITGSTYNVIITEEALNVCNSSPRFKNWPPINICAGFYIQFDHSAIDAEGDSIVYKLCTPFEGLTDNNSYDYPTQPPYTEVYWRPPLYSLNNMLGSKIPLTIDKKTGFMDGVPDILGQFVIGICMEEYRNGKLLSVTKRDFQYNVVFCRAVKAAYFAPDIQCDNLTVNLQNQSFNGSTYNWYFNDPKIIGGGTSNLKSPIFTYSDTGTYLIRLIINENSNCVDTAEKNIILRLKTIKAEFNSKSFFCIDTAQISAENVSIDTTNNIKSIKWTLYNNSNKAIDSSFSLKPIFSVNDNQIYKVRLVTYAKNLCNDTIFYDVVVPKNPVKSPKLSIYADPNLVYSGENSQLFATQYTGFNYQWSPKNEVDNDTIYNPKIRPLVPTTYYLTVSDLNGCVVNDSVTINIRNGVCEDPYIFIPNTFTPNGDGINDVLFVRGGIVDSLEFSIYNRWGQKVFETNDRTIGWDGTFNGEALPNEAFGYILKTKCKNGAEFVKKGNLSILR